MSTLHDPLKKSYTLKELNQMIRAIEFHRRNTRYDFNSKGYRLLKEFAKNEYNSAPTAPYVETQVYRMAYLALKLKKGLT